MMPEYLSLVPLVNVGHMVTLYFSTKSSHFMADPIVSKPWLSGLRNSAAILRTSRSGISADASFSRLRFLTRFPLSTSSFQYGSTQKQPLFFSISPLDGTEELVSVKTLSLVSITSEGEVGQLGPHG